MQINSKDKLDDCTHEIQYENQWDDASGMDRMLKHTGVVLGLLQSYIEKMICRSLLTDLTVKLRGLVT